MVATTQDLNHNTTSISDLCAVIRESRSKAWHVVAVRPQVLYCEWVIEQRVGHGAVYGAKEYEAKRRQRQKPRDES